MSDAWPQSLQPATGPLRRDRLDGAAAGMGDAGKATASLAEADLVPPDMITGMTLFLLARQPRPARPAGGAKRKASAIAGSVWVRERFTMHRPLAADDAFTVTGDSSGRYVRKGRRYGTTTSATHDAAGHLVATNLTTGLLSYRADETLADEVEGDPFDESRRPEPDHQAAAANPHAAALATAADGDRFGGEPLTVTLAMMAARDTENPENPIHSDPAAAAAAGLARPIAGGSHVLAFALEPLLAAWGAESLFHGTCVDVRWKAPTHAEATITPTAVVSAVEGGRLIVDVEVHLDDGATAMIGTVTIPMPATAASDKKER